jgi:hypothetical protein
MRAPKPHVPAAGEKYTAKAPVSGFELNITITTKDATMWKAEQGKGK